MATMQVGCGQITWPGVPEREVLKDIAEAGYEGSPPKLTIDRSAEDTRRLYAEYGLSPAPCYFGASFWQEAQRDRILADAKRHARFVREMGCTELYVAASVPDDQVMRSGRTRARAAGHVTADDALSDEEFARFADVLNEVAAITLGEGVHACFHNHVGTVIETGEELDRLLSLVNDDVALGPDTGHLAWAGEDVLSVCRKYCKRIKTMHLKDIHEDVRMRGRAEGWDYRTFTEQGIFAELGEGSVDFPAILAMLEEDGFEGWLIVETDVTRKASALESATISRDYLRRIGV